MAVDQNKINIGVLALQGAFAEHIYLLKRAAIVLEATPQHGKITWAFDEVRTPEQLSTVDALIIPGGESTTIALIAARSGLLEPLRNFVKQVSLVQRKHVWGTCAGMILLAEAANRTKKNGQELIGGLDVRVSRNHFGRQVESFETDMQLEFLESLDSDAGVTENRPFRAVFIRAPIVERILPSKEGIQDAEEAKPDTVIAPSRNPLESVAPWTIAGDVEVLATLPKRNKRADQTTNGKDGHQEDIVVVRQGNVFGTSFHPELTNDARMHVWWLRQVRTAVLAGESKSAVVEGKAPAE